MLPGFSAVDATYGGEEPHDNSGSLRFISIRHAGDELGAGNELNGLTLAGVGDGTVIENIEVYCNFDDGIEWFGGTVNGKNLVVVFAGDDSFDMDQGYTGVNQFMFAIMPFFNTLSHTIPTDPNAPATTAWGSASGDKGNELDGDDYRPDLTAFWNNVNIRNDVTELIIDGTPWPLSSAYLYNMTIIGTTPDSPNPALPLDATLKATPINPRPNSGVVGTAGCIAPQGPGLSGVTYRGAFERVASVLWTTDWTALSIGGILAD